MSVKIHAHTNKNSKLMTTKTYGALHFKRNVYLFIYTTRRSNKGISWAAAAADMIDYLDGIWKHLVVSSLLSHFTSFHFTRSSVCPEWHMNFQWMCQSIKAWAHTYAAAVTVCNEFFWLHFIFIVAAAIFCMIEEQQQDYFCTVRFYCVCLCLLTFLNCSLCHDASF